MRVCDNFCSVELARELGWQRFLLENSVLDDVVGSDRPIFTTVHRDKSGTTGAIEIHSLQELRMVVKMNILRVYLGSLTRSRTLDSSNDTIDLMMKLRFVALMRFFCARLFEHFTCTHPYAIKHDVPTHNSAQNKSYFSQTT
jgi:hypothetical protein